jgi:hypothetical protein
MKKEKKKINTYEVAQQRIKARRGTVRTAE